eukprot:jgi/Ulvmu1/8599/UM045_0042.1
MAGSKASLLAMCMTLLCILLGVSTGPHGLPCTAAAEMVSQHSTYRSMPGMLPSWQAGAMHDGIESGAELAGHAAGGRKLLAGCHTKKCASALPVCPRCSAPAADDNGGFATTGHCRHSGREFECTRQPLNEGTQD